MYFVIAKISHTGFHPRLAENQLIPKDLVIRYGTPDFSNDGKLNETNEFVLQKNTILSPPTRRQDWYYNAATQDFQQTAP
jgi:hypothetical protein